MEFLFPFGFCLLDIYIVKVYCTFCLNVRAYAVTSSHVINPEREISHVEKKQNRMFKKNTNFASCKEVACCFTKTKTARSKPKLHVDTASRTHRMLRQFVQ
ncbi:hypothetical protein Hanom_Chr09g00805191 [Helianthus anomalus]